ncbi:hypothetical protein PBY51_022447 [Eleginops maclovinus]|uniref:Uncharacterized protein n=1 Tax=Eleginops maclovinus TaxID=56733 RepID=A0AAN7XH82_ELEMC|nr:hypothetical protein PBY51_022447 [Eleginops maclovinus]
MVSILVAGGAEFQPGFQNEFFPHNKSCLPLSTIITCCGVNFTLCPEGLMARGSLCISQADGGAVGYQHRGGFVIVMNDSTAAGL